MSNDNHGFSTKREPLNENRVGRIVRIDNLDGEVVQIGIWVRVDIWNSNEELGQRGIAEIFFNEGGSFYNEVTSQKEDKRGLFLKIEFIGNDGVKVPISFRDIDIFDEIINFHDKVKLAYQESYIKAESFM